MKNRVILSVALLVLCACSSIEKHNDAEPIALQWRIGMSDTIIEEVHPDWYLRYKFRGDSTYSIQWGNDTVANVSERQFNVLGNGVPDVLCITDYYIVLRKSTGTSASSYIWLALKPNAEPEVELAMDEYLFNK